MESRPAPALWASTLRVFDLSLGQMLWSRRSLMLAGLAATPVVLAALIRLSADPGPEGPGPAGATLYGLMIWLVYLRFLVPVLGVFYGTALVADEVEDRTITYLFTRPIPRRAVLFGKYLAYLVCTSLLLLPSLVLVFFLVVPIGGGRTVGEMFPAFVWDLAAVVLGLAAYGAVFGLVGARLKRPLLAGLLFVLGWEPVVQIAPGYTKRATVAYYLQALVQHDMPQDTPVSALMQVFREVPPLPVGLAGLVILTGLALWLGGRTVERREYLLEQ